MIKRCASVAAEILGAIRILIPNLLNYMSKI
jgi:hypothetical protein